MDGILGHNGAGKTTQIRVGPSLQAAHQIGSLIVLPSVLNVAAPLS